MADADIVEKKYPVSGSRKRTGHCIQQSDNAGENMYGSAKRLSLAIVGMGFSGIVAQILILRELFITFLGNELSIGIVLANWLVLEAIGCFIAGKIADRIRNRIETFIGITLLFSLSFPVMIYLTRILKEIIGVGPGEGLGLLHILFSSFLILLPVSIPHGAQFSLGCKAYSDLLSGNFNTSGIRREKKSASHGAGPIGRIYVIETVGTIFGGIALTYLLIPHFHSFEIAIGTALLNSLMCLILLGSFRWRGTPQKLAGYIALTIMFLSSWMIIGEQADSLQNMSIEHQWSGQNVIHYQNSIYGNIAVVRSGEQYTFFYDGVPSVTIPNPDITFVEELVHFPMLCHPDPREVLVIGNGAGGIISELLKYPVDRVEYAELDPHYLQVIGLFPTELTRRELGDERVTVSYIDGRLLMRETSSTYDVVLIGFSDPQTLQPNRLFTEEFFTLVRNRLNNDGILVVSSSGSLSYMGDELRDLNNCILNTLKAVYTHVLIIPGDGKNLFLASSSEAITTIDHNLLSDRLSQRNISTDLVTPGYIAYKLESRWLDFFMTSIEGATEEINRDFRPIGVYYGYSYWNALFSPSLRKICGWFEKVNTSMILITTAAFVLLFLLLSHVFPGITRACVPFTVASTGFAGMVFNLALIFTFQTLFGYVYYQIGIMVTTFMVGAAAGSAFMTSRLERIRKDFAVLLGTEIAIITLSGLLTLTFLLFNSHIDFPDRSFLLHAVFLFLFFLIGALIGLQFPLASKIHLKSCCSISRTAGLIYSSDLLGGWTGGIIGGVILLPVLGLVETGILIVSVKIGSLVILYSSVKRMSFRSGI